MVTWSRLVLASAALVAAASILPGGAAALDEASSFVQCNADGNGALHATDCAVGGIPGVPPSATATAELSPLPFVETHVTSPTTAVIGAGASSQANYSFQVTGGNVGDEVPLLIAVRLEVTSTAGSTAVARVLLYASSLAQPLFEEVCTNSEICDATTLSAELELTALSGSTGDSVMLYAQAQAPATHVLDETASAFADPYIFVDPAFPDAGLYSVVVSEGVGNVAVPEPAKPWLVAAGIVALGLARRRPRG